MVRTRLMTPRKTPSQARSRSTVDALVEATARVLVRDGFDRTTTNRIADVAGVGIGSLYQYYPSKDALVAAVVDRHHDRIAQRVRGALADIAGQPIEAAMRKLVAAAVQAHRRDPDLDRAIAEQIPRVGRLDQAEALRRDGCSLFRTYLDSRRHELRDIDRGVAAAVSGMAIDALTRAALLVPAAEPDRDEALISDTARLISGYLRSSPGRGAAAAS